MLLAGAHGASSVLMSVPLGFPTCIVSQLFSNGTDIRIDEAACAPASSIGVRVQPGRAHPLLF